MRQELVRMLNSYQSLMTAVCVCVGLSVCLTCRLNSLPFSLKGWSVIIWMCNIPFSQKRHLIKPEHIRLLPVTHTYTHIVVIPQPPPPEHLCCSYLLVFFLPLRNPPAPNPSTSRACTRVLGVHLDAPGRGK